MDTKIVKLVSINYSVWNEWYWECHRARCWAVKAKWTLLNCYALLAGRVRFRKSSITKVIVWGTAGSFTPSPHCWQSCCCREV